LRSASIRYRGNLKTEIKHVVLITTLHKAPEDLVQNPLTKTGKSTINFYTLVRDVWRPKDGERKSRLKTTNS